MPIFKQFIIHVIELIKLLSFAKLWIFSQIVSLLIGILPNSILLAVVSSLESTWFGTISVFSSKTFCIFASE